MVKDPTFIAPQADSPEATATKAPEALEPVAAEVTPTVDDSTPPVAVPEDLPPVQPIDPTPPKDDEMVVASLDVELTGIEQSVLSQLEEIAKGMVGYPLTRVADVLHRNSARDIRPRPIELSSEFETDWKTIDRAITTNGSCVVEARHFDGVGCLVRSCTITSRGEISESLCFVPGVELLHGKPTSCLVKSGFRAA